MKIAIVDDEQIYIDILQKKISIVNEIYNMTLEVSVFNSGISYLNANKIFDLVFMDIEMPNLNGIKTLERYREYDQKAILIFLTNHMEFCQEGYLVNAFRFLHKNDDDNKFYEAISSAIKIMTHRKKISITVVSGSQIILEHSEIICVESYNRGTKIYTDEETFICREKISEIANQLDGSYFYRTHRAFLINWNHFLGYDKQDIFMHGGVIAPLSEKKKIEFRKLLFNWKFANGNG